VCTWNSLTIKKELKFYILKNINLPMLKFKKKITQIVKIPGVKTKIVLLLLLL